MANGFLLIDKKIGVTSRSVDNKIQRLFLTKKVGHLGTLDPFASGLLIVAVDKGCKSLPYIDDSFKTYEASLFLGQKTDSGDLTGQIIEEKDVPIFNVNDVEKVFNSLLGESEQIPPMASAIHLNGDRLYDLHRKGIKADIPARKIFIKELKIIKISAKQVDFSVICSKGTYIRTLGEEIANRLNTVGHLISLRRTAIGDIDINKSKDIDEINENDLISPTDLISYKRFIVEDEGLIKDIQNGKNISLQEKEDRVLFCYYLNGELLPLAVYNRYKEKTYSILRGLW